VIVFIVRRQKRASATEETGLSNAEQAALRALLSEAENPQGKTSDLNKAEKE